MSVTLSDGRRVEAVLARRGSPCDNLVRLSDGSCWIVREAKSVTPFDQRECARIEREANKPRASKGGDGTFEARAWDWLSFGVWSNVKVAFEVAT